MKNIFDHEPNIGYSTPEPSLRKIVELYYRQHFAAKKANELTAEYFRQLTFDFVETTDMVVAHFYQSSTTPNQNN